jgi:hypothetical protein
MFRLYDHHDLNTHRDRKVRAHVPNQIPTVAHLKFHPKVSSVVESQNKVNTPFVESDSKLIISS